MYQNHVNQVKGKSFGRNVIVPTLIAFVATTIIMLITTSTSAFIFEQKPFPASDFGLTSAVGMFLSILLSILLFTKVSGIRTRDLGYVGHHMPKNYILGAVGGIVAITIVFVPSMLTHAVDTANVFHISKTWPLIAALLFFLFQGMFEELVFRGYLMPQFSRVMGDIPSILLTSILFMLFHLGNPNTTVMGFVNLFVFGIVFAVVYYRMGNIWIVGAAHSFWNYFLGNIYGSNVSGNVIKDSLLASPPTERFVWLSGGQVGLEGSVITTVVGIVIIVYFWKFFNRKQKTA